jgi:LmeA-like phospholipid-binding
VTRPRGIGRWDPFRPLDLVGALWSTAVAVPPVSTGAAAAYRTVFMTVKRLVVGRRLTLHSEGGPVTMIVSELESRLDLRRLSVGQLDDVQVAATDIVWGVSRFEHASAVLRNVHVRPGAPPVVVAAPVYVTLDVPTDTLDDLFVTMVPRFAGTIGDDAVARLRWARRPRLGHLEVDAELAGSALFLKPRAVTVGTRRWTLPLRTPARRLELPELPHGLQLTGVRLEPGLLRLSGTLPEWRMDLTRRHLEHFIEI